MKLRHLSLLICLTSLPVLAQKNIAGNYTYKTECFGAELDGSQTVKSWGTSKNKSEAIEQAKKNALLDVIFNGITEGKQDCDFRPLVPEVNAQSKYEDYFSGFFKEGGQYLNYANLENEKMEKKLFRFKKKSREGVTMGVVIKVLRADLKKKLIKDGIIKPI